MSNDFINATFDLKGGKVVKTELNKYFKTIARNDGIITSKKSLLATDANRCMGKNHC